MASYWARIWVFGLVWTIIYLNFTADDAYIFFRYGKVLLKWHTWNWNPTGAPIEAYTSAIYAFLSIIPAALHVSAALFFKLFGLALLLLLTYSIWKKALTGAGAVLGILAIALQPYFWIHAYSGLETPLFILLVYATGYLALKGKESSERGLFVLCLLLPLTRPEGAIFSAAGLLIYLVRSRGHVKHLVFLISAIVAGIVYFCARVWYFHQLLPNSFYVKVAGKGNIGSFGHNVWTSKIFLVCLLLVLILSRSKALKVYCGAALFVVFFLYLPHFLAMNYADRFYFQVTAPIVVVFFATERVDRAKRWATVLLVLLLGTVTKSGVGSFLYFPYTNAAHGDLGRRLAQFSPQHTVVLGDAGMIPYYSGWRSFDYLGLCTNSIAKHGINEGFLSSTQPDLILVYAMKPTLASAAAYPANPGAVIHFLQNSPDYEYVAASKWHSYYMLSFLRKGTTDSQEIKEALLANQAETDAFRFSYKNLVLQRYTPFGS